MPRCGECNGCLNHADGFTCDTCKYCLDSNRLGGPARLRTPCEKRSCVQNRKGTVVDVQRMKIGEKEKGSATRRGRKRKSTPSRRDSGFCNNNNNVKDGEAEQNYGEGEKR